jgi:hypothetical protein
MRPRFLSGRIGMRDLVFVFLYLPRCERGHKLYPCTFRAVNVGKSFSPLSS